MSKEQFGDSIFNPLIKRVLELLIKTKGQHWFELELRNIDRNTDRETWRKISRWLRIARNKVEEKLRDERYYGLEN